jgi:hypothetical protein
MFKHSVLLLLLGMLLQACATKEQAALGDVVFGSGLWGGPAVYRNGIRRNYRVMKQFYQKERQIIGRRAMFRHCSEGFHL